MMKCNKTEDELRKTLKENIDNQYYDYKEKILESPAEDIWDDAYMIAIKQNLYMFLLYKSCNAPKEELQCLQSKNMFNKVAESFTQGHYSMQQSDFEELLNHYIENQKKEIMNGGME